MGHHLIVSENKRAKSLRKSENTRGPSANKSMQNYYSVSFFDSFSVTISQGIILRISVRWFTVHIVFWKEIIFNKEKLRIKYVASHICDAVSQN